LLKLIRLSICQVTYATAGPVGADTTTTISFPPISTRGTTATDAPKTEAPTTVVPKTGEKNLVKIDKKIKNNFLKNVNVNELMQQKKGQQQQLLCLNVHQKVNTFHYNVCQM